MRYVFAALLLPVATVSMLLLLAAYWIAAAAYFAAAVADGRPRLMTLDEWIDTVRR